MPASRARGATIRSDTGRNGVRPHERQRTNAMQGQPDSRGPAVVGLCNDGGQIVVALSPELMARAPRKAPEWFMEMLARAENIAGQRDATSSPFDFTPSTRQMLAIGQLLDPDVEEVAYGGARYGGKSYLLCKWAYHHALAIIEHCNLKPSEHPIPVGFIGRKQYVDLMSTTLDTWKQVIPSSEYRIREQAHEIVIRNTVVIRFGALDITADGADREKTSKFLGAQYVFFCIDQAEETTQDEVKNLRGALRQEINGEMLPSYYYKGLFTANPRACWLRDEFVREPNVGKVFVPASPLDNPKITPNYLIKLYNAYKHRLSELEAMLLGQWEGFAAVNQCISEAMLLEAKKIIRLPGPVIKFLSVDPAREGDDECVINTMHNTDIVDQVIIGMSPGDVIQTQVAIAARKVGPVGDVPIVIDATGGLGVIGDIIAATGEHVIMIEYAARASKPKWYYNIRAEMWDHAAKMLEAGRVSLQWDDPELTSQLCAPEYTRRGGRFLVEPKSDIKKRLSGKSPDRADAWVQGLYALEIMRGLIICPEGVTIKQRQVDKKPGRCIDMDTFDGRERYDAEQARKDTVTHGW